MRPSEGQLVGKIGQDIGGGAGSRTQKGLPGVQVVICHPKLVETGLDLLDFPTILFYESGYSLHTLRQASRRSWRIGQRRPVRVKFLCYDGSAPEMSSRNTKAQSCTKNSPNKRGEAPGLRRTMLVVFDFGTPG